MKRTIFITIVCSLSMALSAQIKVSQSGRLGINTVSPLYGYLHVAKDGNDYGINIYEQSLGGSTFRIYRKDNFAYLTRGGVDSRGLCINSNGQITLKSSATTGSNFISYSNSTSQLHFVVYYGGSNRFFVTGDGRIYSYGSYITSDSAKKKNIQTISNAREKINLIKGITFEYV